MKRLVVIFLTCVSCVRAELPDSVASPKIEVRAVRLTENVIVDGRLTESVWQNDFGVTKFTQREPVEGGQPAQKTVVRIAYDDAALYVGVRMYDTAPDSIIARLGRRDAQTNSDRFTVFIDAYHDRRNGFYFGVNAAGTQYDGVLFNDDWDDDTWDGVWEAKVNIDKEGWTAEIRVPFSQLHFQDAAIYIWGINCSRDIPRNNERDFIVFTPKNGSGFVSRFVNLTGIENISPPRQVEILPYVTARAEYLQHDANDPFKTGSKYTPRFGGDLKLGIGSNLTLNATVYPDFGQVEIDPAVVNLSDVETIFEEKRPFFVEGSTIFNFGFGGANNNWSFNFPNPDFFYTRRIGRTPQGSTPDDADFVDVPQATDILGAAKLSGKVGDNWTIGTIQALTAREYADVQTTGQHSRLEVEPMTYYGVVRAMKEFDQGSQALGCISTAAVRNFQDDRLRDEINKHGETFGLDGWTFLDSDKMWVLTGWSAFSHVGGGQARMIDLQRNSRHYFQRPDADYLGVDSAATSLTGSAGRIRLNKQKGNFYMNAAFGFINPEFDPNDLGFLSRGDVLNGHIVASYRWTEPGSFYRYIELGGASFRSYDYGGDKIWDGLFHFGYIEFPNFYSVDWNFAYNPQTMNNRRTRGGPLTINTPGYQIGIFPRSDRTKNVVFSLGWNTYQADYNRTWDTFISLEWRPAANISLQLSPEVSYNFEKSHYIDVFEDPLATATYGHRYVFAELKQATVSAGIRLNWTFTPKLSLQMYLQPLISAGNYEHFKELAQPGAYDFNIYGENGSTFDSLTYVADPDGNGPAQPMQLSNPDFNIKSIRANLVLRWEYLAGSTFYLVWTQSRTDVEDTGDLQFNHSVNRLLETSPDNIFLAKVSYWWSL